MQRPYMLIVSYTWKSMLGYSEIFEHNCMLLSLDKISICCGVNQIDQTINNHTHVHDINNGMAYIEIIADNLEATD